ncbi:MAG: ice-binding family protein [Flavobacterium sp.]|uniref:ice-binding family protein n=1 Tax=Flavobacterium sp. TaxID=239 RepID=UPI0032641045
MKTKLLYQLLGIIISITGLRSNAQAPVLGTATDFVIFSRDGAVTSNVTNSLMTHLTGNVGTDTSGATSTGFGNVNGVMHDDDTASHIASADVLTAYTQLNALIPNYFPSSLLGNGATLTAGTYFINSGASLDGELILDAESNPNAVFVFQIQGAFSTNALSQVTLINGAKSCNVFWKVEGLVDMSSGTKMKGTVVANNAAILMGINSTLDGRLFSTTGAITVNGIVAKLPLGCARPALTGPTAPNLGTVVCYALFSGNQNVINDGVTLVTGDVGTNVGLTTGFDAANVTGTIHPEPDTSTAQCATDLLTVYSYLNTLPTDIELLYPAQFGNDLLLTPHAYLLNTATVLTNNLYLDAEGNANAVFTINIYGAFSTSPSAKVFLLNGAQAQNVYWKVDGAVSISDHSEFTGTLVANNAAINVATGSTVTGRMLTTNGALTTFAITDTMPVGCTSLGIGDITPNSKNVGVLYPNPFADSFEIKLSDLNSSGEFYLYTTLGELVYHKAINETTTIVKTNLSAGMYFYRLISSTGLIQTGKLLSK